MTNRDVVFRLIGQAAITVVGGVICAFLFWALLAVGFLLG